MDLRRILSDRLTIVALCALLALLLLFFYFALVFKYFD
jgi:hypothetical protein